MATSARKWSVRFIVVMAELVSALTSAAVLRDMEGRSAKKYCAAHPVSLVADVFGQMCVSVPVDSLARIADLPVALTA